MNHPSSENVLVFAAFVLARRWHASRDDAVDAILEVAHSCGMDVDALAAIVAIAPERVPS